jgi:hypothetical protein
MSGGGDFFRKLAQLDHTFLQIETRMEHVGKIQGTFRKHSENNQGTIRAHSGHFQGTFRKPSGKLQGNFREFSGNRAVGDWCFPSCPVR